MAQVRTYTDMMNAARTAYTMAIGENPGQAGTFRALISRLSADYSPSTPLPTIFAAVANRLRSLRAPKAEAWVRALARDYWIKVEGGGATGTGVVATTPVASAAGTPTADISAGNNGTVEPFYQKWWFAPVAALLAIGGAAAVMLRK